MFYDSPLLDEKIPYQFLPGEVGLLQELAAEVKSAAAAPIMEQRRKLWTAHNDLELDYPLILVFPEGAWSELIREEELQCRSAAGREIELNLRKRLYSAQKIGDDGVLDSRWVVRKVIQITGWGLTGRWQETSSSHGARGFEPVMLETSDLAKVRIPEVVYHDQLSQTTYQQMGDLLGDDLDVSLEGFKHISYHLMAQLTELRGLEQTMLDFYLEPQFVHDAMAFLEEAQHSIRRSLIAGNLLSLNNDNTYNSTGGNGFTRQLPGKEFDPEQVRPADMWASAESQELAQVSPKHHAEFALPYEKRLLEPFGLTGYGCCEDLTDKLDAVLTLPNLRRVSISPWANVDRCAEIIGSRYIFSWKPHPGALIGDFNSDRIKEYIRHTVDVTRKNGCILEIILKDTHTCEGHPERFSAWVEIARDVIREEYGDPPCPAGDPAGFSGQPSPPDSAAGE